MRGGLAQPGDSDGARLRKPGVAGLPVRTKARIRLALAVSNGNIAAERSNRIFGDFFSE